MEVSDWISLGALAVSAGSLYVSRKNLKGPVLKDRIDEKNRIKKEVGILQDSLQKAILIDKNLYKKKEAVEKVKNEMSSFVNSISATDQNIIEFNMNLNVLLMNFIILDRIEQKEVTIDMLNDFLVDTRLSLKASFDRYIKVEESKLK